MGFGLEELPTEVTGTPSPTALASEREGVPTHPLGRLSSAALGKGLPGERHPQEGCRGHRLGFQRREDGGGVFKAVDPERDLPQQRGRPATGTPSTRPKGLEKFEGESLSRHVSTEAVKLRYAENCKPAGSPPEGRLRSLAWREIHGVPLPTASEGH